SNLVRYPRSEIGDLMSTLEQSSELRTLLNDYANTLEHSLRELSSPSTDGDWAKIQELWNGVEHGLDAVVVAVSPAKDACDELADLRRHVAEAGILIDLHAIRAGALSDLIMAMRAHVTGAIIRCETGINTQASERLRTSAPSRRAFPKTLLFPR